MASASAVCHLGLLHMWPLQLWLKSWVPWTAWTLGRFSIAVTCGCIEALALCEQAAILLLWADSRLLSIRATHIPGLLNRGADMLSRRRIPQGEWRLHPESVQMIWNLYGKAKVDLFATSENAHCPLFFSLSHSPLKGDALTAHWPAARLYAFPPIKISSVILIAPNWPNQPWFPDLTELLIAPPWPIPIRRDMLSQADGSVWHPNPELWSLHVWLLQGCQRS